MKKLDPTAPRKLTFSEENMTNGVTVLSNIGDIEKVLGQPTVERPVYFSLEDSSSEKILTPKHKAIVTGDRIVAIQRSSYNLITNRDLVMPVLDQISNTSSDWSIDSRHSFVSDTKMRIAIKLNELSFTPSDGNPITMMLNLSNSYDASERISIAWGMLRLVCTNGMTVFSSLAKAKAKHTVNFDPQMFSTSIMEAYEAIPIINQRLNLLSQESFSVTDSFRDTVEQQFGKRAVGYLDIENAQRPIETSWDAYNLLTYYISHYLHIKQRGMYQARAGELFSI